MNELELLNNIVSSVNSIIGDNMENKCDAVQGLIGRYLSELNIHYNACTTTKIIDEKLVGHSFIVAYFNDNAYIIDPSFIQFKYMNNDDLYIKGIRCISKSPYYYANLINSNLCNELVTNGYIKLDEESAYFYGNAFYQTKVGIKEGEVIPMLSGNMFIKLFSKGNDELINYDLEEISDVISKHVL